MTDSSPAPQPGQPGWAPPPPAASERPGPMPGWHYAGFWIRVVAYILDGIVLVVLTGALGSLLGGGATMVNIENGVTTVDYTASGIWTFLGLVYFIGFWAWRGQTPGMLPFNMKIVMAEDGSKVDVVRALLRYVGLLISFAVLLLGVLWVAWDRRKQGWMDKIAGTVVIRPN